ncbi:isochorismate synthase MenF [Jeotgalibacillus sp. R-1-5s-1]|uniref:isochorismate synthase n=1 Tax=Jeotgalibacillus sp. R-1-5s-1 TaxID=2555897 RepID=UPI00141B1790|nr:isochorismate synthase [Jeotgalibacillus sp. R-1-5s-1]
MKILHESQGFTAFERAFESAEKTNKKVLYSKVMKIDTVDPLQFYEAGYSIYHGERSYWEDPKGETTLVGLGNAEIFSSEREQSRFDELHKKWQKFLKGAVIEDRAGMSTGPVLMGGFTFDPKQETAIEWSNFSKAYFHLPSFMLTVDHDGSSYLTVNIVCMEGDFAGEVWNRMQLTKEQLMNGAVTGLQDVSVESIEEIRPEEWKTSLTSVVERINEGEMEKVVLARKIKVDFNNKKRSDSVLERLRDDQADSFIFSFEVADTCFIGATPERLVKKEGNEVLSTCLAGSIVRGKTIEEDEKLGQELLNDQKNLVEHEIVVRMISKNLEELCESIHVPAKPGLMKMRDIQHLYTPVKGQSDSGKTIVDFVEKLHPTPALGGTPTDKALQVIREEEDMNRGLYAAPVGWINADGDGEFAVAIRSGLLIQDYAYLYAGCGVVKDSEAESEYQETLIKFRPMLRAVGGTMK